MIVLSTSFKSTSKEVHRINNASMNYLYERSEGLRDKVCETEIRIKLLESIVE